MKKRYVILILFLIIYNFSFSQNIQVIYHTDFAHNAAKADRIISEHTKLIIGKESSEFYSPFRASIDSLLAVMENRGASFSEYQTEKSKLPDGNLEFRIYKNYPQKGSLTFTDRFASTNYKYIEPMVKPTWKIENETKEILGYKCQKATTKFKGRTWTAWYASDIPIQEGPWKLWGLPGLILEAKDSDTLYNFVAIGLEKKETMDIALKKKQYIDCNRDEYIKQKTIYSNDPIAAMSKAANTQVTIKDQNGDLLKSKNRLYIDIELDTE